MCDACQYHRPFDWFYEEPPIRTMWTTGESVPSKVEGEGEGKKGEGKVEEAK